MSVRKLRYLAEYGVFRVLVGVLQALSLRQCVRLAEMLAFVMVRVLPHKLTRYEVARSNIRLALGAAYTERQIDELIYRMWVHLFRMVTEIIQLPRKLRLDNCADVIRFHNRDETVRAMSAGRPVIVLSGHYGNWEMANATFGFFGFPLGVVARDLDNPHLHDWFRRFRQSTGNALISKKGGYDAIVRMLEHRGYLGMLADQDAGPRGLFVDFCGREASTFKSIALLAIQHRALILVGYARRLPDDFENSHWVRYELGCEEIIDPLEVTGGDEVFEITQRFTKALERAVRSSPEQYFWVHRRWKSVPRRRKNRQAA